MKFVQYSPRHLVIATLQKHFGEIVYERLPERDSWLTNKNHIITVDEVSDNQQVRTCEADRRRMILDVTIYERDDSCEVGLVEALDLAISRAIQQSLGEYDCLRIDKIFRQGSRLLPYVSERFRARTVTFSLDYGVL